MSGANEPALAGASSRFVTAAAEAAPIVVLRGDIDGGCAEELCRTFRRLGQHHRSAILDVTQVTSIDGAILVVVVTASERLSGGCGSGGRPARSGGCSPWPGAGTR